MIICFTHDILCHIFNWKLIFFMQYICLMIFPSLNSSQIIPIHLNPHPFFHCHEKTNSPLNKIKLKMTRRKTDQKKKKEPKQTITYRHRGRDRDIHTHPLKTQLETITYKQKTWRLKEKKPRQPFETKNPPQSLFCVSHSLLAWSLCLGVVCKSMRLSWEKHLFSM